MRKNQEDLPTDRYLGNFTEMRPQVAGQLADPHDSFSFSPSQIKNIFPSAQETGSTSGSWFAPWGLSPVLVFGGRGTAP